MNQAELQAGMRHILIMHRGRERAISADELSRLFNLPDRIIRKSIEQLITDHFPVCSVTSEPAGYFFPATVDEAREYTKSLQKRACRIFVRKRNIIRDVARYYEKARQEAMV